MRIKLVSMMALLAACSGDDGATQRDGGVDTQLIDAPEMVPMITSFTAMPTSIQAGVATPVTWSWTYAVEPTLPDPACSIDNGVGAVTRGQQTSVTITAVTTFTLTCTNRAGTGAKQLVLAVPPVAPVLATFTATPPSITPNVATDVTFAWTYSNTPSPTPTCTIDSIGAATNGGAVSLTLPQARTYRLRCMNTQGTATRDVTVGVSECAGTAQCGTNATCTDTLESYTCACNSGYTGNGDVCSQTGLACSTPNTCDANATCVGGTTCVCNIGFYGDGVTCSRARISFITSTTGTGNLSTWAGATGSGLAAADSVCQARATAASLPGTYVAWMSDANNDAYCRVHGLAGKKVNNCGLGALPVAAGPWVRLDSARSPAAPTIDQLLAPTRQTFYPVIYDEVGTLVTAAPLLVWTGTDDTGVLTGTACTDWSDGTSAVRGAMGDINGGGTAWTDQAGTADPTCNSTGRLRCVETLAGPALPPRHAGIVKRAFLTSVVGNGVMSTWTDAQGLTGISAADAICQARARFAGYQNAPNFRAWAAYSSVYASSRINYNGPWYRPDGILVASSESDLIDGRLGAPMYLTETGAYMPGNAETGSVWTGAMYSGYYYSSSYSCLSWSSTSYSSIVGRHDLADFRWSNVGTTSIPSPVSCTATDYRLYCLDDTP